MASSPATPSPHLRRRRGSSNASTGSLLGAARHVEAKVQKAVLWAWDELPEWRRDNAFIVRGYRPDSNGYRASLASLAYLHNESVNIWSHLLGALLFAAAALLLCSLVQPRYEGASSADMLVFSCFFAGAVCCLGMSATFHALSNHSEGVAKWGNKLDYSGIVCLIVGSYVPTLYYGFFCHPGLMAVYLYAISLLGLGCLTVSWFEHFRTPAWRAYRALLFVGLGVSGIVPVVHGLWIYGYRALEDRMALSWVLLQGAQYIFGAFLYAARWPERSFPGAFDIWGSSHQVFHLFVVSAAATHLYGLVKSFDYHHSVMGAQC